MLTGDDGRRRQGLVAFAAYRTERVATQQRHGDSDGVRPVDGVAADRSRYSQDIDLQRWRKRVGVEPTRDVERPSPDLKSGRPTGVRFFSPRRAAAPSWPAPKTCASGRTISRPSPIRRVNFTRRNAPARRWRDCADTCAVAERPTRAARRRLRGEPLGDGGEVAQGSAPKKRFDPTRTRSRPPPPRTAAAARSARVDLEGVGQLVHGRRHRPAPSSSGSMRGHRSASPEAGAASWSGSRTSDPRRATAPSSASSRARAGPSWPRRADPIRRAAAFPTGPGSRARSGARRRGWRAPPRASVASGPSRTRARRRGPRRGGGERRRRPLRPRPRSGCARGGTGPGRSPRPGLRAGPPALAPDRACPWPRGRPGAPAGRGRAGAGGCR